MAVLANMTPSTNEVDGDVKPRKSFADTKRFISNEFYQALNRHMPLPDGRSVTYLQQAVAKIVDMATDPERDDYTSLAAAKFMFEHLEGKASTMKEDTHQEMPKLVICVGETKVDDVRKRIEDIEGAEPAEDIAVEISNPDGSDSEEYIV